MAKKLTLKALGDRNSDKFKALAKSWAKMTDEEKAAKNCNKSLAKALDEATGASPKADKGEPLAADNANTRRAYLRSLGLSVDQLKRLVEDVESVIAKERQRDYDRKKAAFEAAKAAMEEAKEALGQA